jgi:hypothetical protein
MSQVAGPVGPPASLRRASVEGTAPKGGAPSPRVERAPPGGRALWQDRAVPFPYYRRLSARQQKIYRRSDAIDRVEIPDAEGLRLLVEQLRAALGAEDRRAVERASQALALDICERLGVPRIGVKVLAARPTGNWGELHGLYEPERVPPLVTLWMRTAAQRRVVAFKSFLRTLIHELLHHLDYEYFALEETFHTEGFFRRESSVARQLLGEPAAAESPEPAADPPRTRRRPARRPDRG